MKSAVKVGLIGEILSPEIIGSVVSSKPVAPWATPTEYTRNEGEITGRLDGFFRVNAGYVLIIGGAQFVTHANSGIQVWG